MLLYFSVKFSRSKTLLYERSPWMNVKSTQGEGNVFEYGLKHTALLVLNNK